MRVTDPALQQLLDIEAIKQLKHRYFRLMDAKAWDELAAMFTDDAQIIYGRGQRQLLPPDVHRSDDVRFWSTRDELFASHARSRAATGRITARVSGETRPGPK